MSRFMSHHAKTTQNATSATCDTDNLLLREKIQIMPIVSQIVSKTERYFNIILPYLYIADMSFMSPLYVCTRDFRNELTYLCETLKFFKGRPTIQHQVMQKKTLCLLGRLLAMEEALWNQLAENPRSNELQNKYRLVRKIKRNLEEQGRGFLKSKVHYDKMAEAVLKSVKQESYVNLHKKVMEVVFGRGSQT